MASLNATKVAAATILLLISSPAAQATPDHRIEVQERIIGTNRTGFVILRSEWDNLGSYFLSREKRFLDVYEKIPTEPDSKFGSPLAKRTSSTLLLDITHAADAEGSDRWAEGKVTKTVHAKDDGVLLADLLEKYPVQPAPWDAEKFAKLSAVPTPGVRIGSISVIWGGWIKERFGPDRNEEIDWKLDGVAEDQNCLHLKVSIEGQQRWACLLQRTTRQVLAHLDLKPFYLIAGIYDSEEAALKSARALKKKCEAKRDARFYPEVWSVWERTDDLVYVVADGNSQNNIREDAFSKLEKLLEVDLTVRSSEFFRERFDRD